MDDNGKDYEIISDTELRNYANLEWLKQQSNEVLCHCLAKLAIAQRAYRCHNPDLRVYQRYRNKILTQIIGLVGAAILVAVGILGYHYIQKIERSGKEVPVNHSQPEQPHPSPAQSREGTP